MQKFQAEASDQMTSSSGQDQGHAAGLQALIYNNHTWDFQITVR